MAQRRASRQAASRKAAASAAARFREREDRLEQLAAAFLNSHDAMDRIGEKYERKRAALARQEEAELAAERSRAGHVVRTVVEDLGVAKREAAERLMISPRQVTEALKQAGDPEPGHDVESGAVETPDEGGEDDAALAG